jgi:hypothetical protein
MRTNLLVVIICAAVLMHASLFAQPPTNSVEDPVASEKRQFVLADIAGFPMNHTYSMSWQPYQSIRVGYAREIDEHLELRVCAEYAQFDFDPNDRMSTYTYSPGRRRDFAIYPEIVAFGFVDIALGGYYTIQDEIIHWSIFSPQLTTDPVVKKFGVYIHYGASGSIHIAGPVNISLGLFLRNDLKDGLYFGGRAGIKFEI